MVCKGCEKRHLNCHSTCEEYKEWKRKNDERNDQIRKAKEKDKMLNDYCVKKSRKIKEMKSYGKRK